MQTLNNTNSVSFARNEFFQINSSYLEFVTHTWGGYNSKIVSILQKKIAKNAINIVIIKSKEHDQYREKSNGNLYNIIQGNNTVNSLFSVVLMLAFFLKLCVPNRMISSPFHTYSYAMVNVWVTIILGNLFWLFQRSRQIRFIYFTQKLHRLQ